jgi:hypothetical protein
LQLLGVLGAWAVIEALRGASDRPPIWFLPALVAAGIAHIGYYLVLLPSLSADHRVLQAQWTLPWLADRLALSAALGLVAVLAIGSLMFRRRLGVVLDARWSLLAAWFVVSLALANHDLFVKPVQPIHFTRGYLWAPLFLLGAPALLAIIQAALSRPVFPVLRVLAISVVLALFLADNFVWLHLRIRASLDGTNSELITLDRSERQILTDLAGPRFAGFLVVSEDDKIGYLATVYTPLRSWYSHVYNTPFASKRKEEIGAFLNGDTISPPWGDRPIALVIKSSNPRRLEFMAGGFTTFEQNDEFIILGREGSSKLATPKQSPAG